MLMVPWFTILKVAMLKAAAELAAHTPRSFSSLPVLKGPLEDGWMASGSCCCCCCCCVGASASASGGCDESISEVIIDDSWAAADEQWRKVSID